MKKNILLVLLSSLTLAGCDLDLGIFKLSQEAKTAIKTVEITGKTTENPQNNEFTKTVYTSGESIQYFATSPGVSANTNLLSGVDAATRLEKCLKDQLNNNKYISSGTFTNVISANYGETGYQIIQLGSGKSTGSLEWNCTSKIYNVVIKGYLYDEEAKLSVNSNSSTFSLSGTISASFESGATNLTLASVSGRVHIESLTITWKS